MIRNIFHSSVALFKRDVYCALIRLIKDRCVISTSWSINRLYLYGSPILVDFRDPKILANLAVMRSHQHPGWPDRGLHFLVSVIDGIINENPEGRTGDVVTIDTKQFNFAIHCTGFLRDALADLIDQRVSVNLALFIRKVSIRFFHNESGTVCISNLKWNAAIKQSDMYLAACVFPLQTYNRLRADVMQIHGQADDGIAHRLYLLSVMP